MLVQRLKMFINRIYGILDVYEVIKYEYFHLLGDFASVTDHKRCYIVRYRYRYHSRH